MPESAWGGGTWSWGVYLVPGRVLSPGGCLLKGGLLWGRGSGPRRGVCSWGVSALGGVQSQGGDVCSGGVSAPGGSGPRGVSAPGGEGPGPKGGHVTCKAFWDTPPPDGQNS